MFPTRLRKTPAKPRAQSRRLQQHNASKKPAAAATPAVAKTAAAAHAAAAAPTTAEAAQIVAHADAAEDCVPGRHHRDQYLFIFHKNNNDNIGVGIKLWEADRRKRNQSFMHIVNIILVQANMNGASLNMSYPVWPRTDHYTRNARKYDIFTYVHVGFNTLA